MKRLTRKVQLAFLEQYRTTDKVLDIGAGRPPYGRFFPNRISVDIDKAHNPDIVADVTKLPFADESYGMVLCVELFEHLQDPQKAADELHRILRKGGRLVLTTRFLYPLHSVPGDYWRFTPYILKEIFKKWHIEKLEYESEPFSAMGILLQRIGLQTDLYCGKPTKALVYALSWFFTKLDWLVKAQYGEIERTTETEGVFSTGIYMVLKK